MICILFCLFSYTLGEHHINIHRVLGLVFLLRSITIILIRYGLVSRSMMQWKRSEFLDRAERRLFVFQTNHSQIRSIEISERRLSFLTRWSARWMINDETCVCLCTVNLLLPAGSRSLWTAVILQWILEEQKYRHRCVVDEHQTHHSPTTVFSSATENDSV